MVELLQRQALRVSIMSVPHVGEILPCLVLCVTFDPRSSQLILCKFRERFHGLTSFIWYKKSLYPTSMGYIRFGHGGLYKISVKP